MSARASLVVIVLSSLCASTALGQTSETCPGEAIDVSGLNPCSAATATVTGSTASATDDFDESWDVSCWDWDLFIDVFNSAERVYQLTLTGPRWLAIDAVGSSYDTLLGVASPCPGAGTFCLYNDDHVGLQSGFGCRRFDAGTYSIIISGYDYDSGDFVLNVRECETGCPVDPGVCGDGHVDAGEACDDGNADDTDECLSTCVAARCGDGVVGPGSRLATTATSLAATAARPPARSRATSRSAATT